MEKQFGFAYDTLVRVTGPIFGRTKDECESFLDGVGWFQETFKPLERCRYVVTAWVKFLGDKRDRNRSGLILSTEKPKLEVKMNMNAKDKYWLDECLDIFQKRFVDPFWKPCLDLHNQCSDEWRDMDVKEMKENILDAYGRAHPYAKHCLNTMVEYILESDMQGITLSPTQIMAVLDCALYLLHCDELIKR